MDLTFQIHDEWHLFQVRCEPLCSDGFARLGSHGTSLANHTGATIQGAVAEWQSSKNCPSQTSYFGTATSYHGLNWSQVVSSYWDPGFS